MDIKVIVATHKLYRMPGDKMYLPVQAGASLRTPLPYHGDNEGVNISAKNPTYCELTCLYWAWKNLKADYIGLVHYRRHFRGRTFAGKWDAVLDSGRAGRILESSDIILPKKRFYLIETIYSHYAHSHYPQDLRMARRVLKDLYPDYVASFDKVMNMRSAHMFNMLIMKKDILDEYCSWLFSILEEVEKRLDISSYSDFDKRVFGRISELMLNVWIVKNGYPYTELPVIYVEGEAWARKLVRFIRRKFIPEHTA